MLGDIDLMPLMEPLLWWFIGHARALPWREEPTPYRVWVSEIMLQQTRVEAVKPYFARFTERLPDVPYLAACPEDELLKLWEGLGYYSRVRNMQKAARQMVEEYGGRLPSDYSALLKLSGIGRYTAGAVASIAYGLPAPAVDGNVLRVLARVSADNTDIMEQSFRRKAEELVGELLGGLTLPDTLKGRLKDGNVPGAVNQALMELGAAVCLPNGAPLCGQCPWEGQCHALKGGLTASLPVRKKARKRRIEKRTVLLIGDGEKVALRKRPNQGLLAGLYELPNVEGTLSLGDVLVLAERAGFSPLGAVKLEDAKHVFSHLEWHMGGYAIRVGNVDLEAAEEKGFLFVDATDVAGRYAIPSAFAAYTRYITEL